MNMFCDLVDTGVIIWGSISILQWTSHLTNIDYKVFLVSATEPRAIDPWSHQYGNVDVLMKFLRTFSYNTLLLCHCWERCSGANKTHGNTDIKKGRTGKKFVLSNSSHPHCRDGKMEEQRGVSLTETFAGTRSTSPESYKSAQSTLSQVLGMALVQLNLLDQKC